MEITEIEDLLCRAININQIHTKFILRLMLEGKVSVEDIPIEIRIVNRSIYLTAFRCARNNSEMYAKTLCQLKNDINYMENSEQIEEFMIDEFMGLYTDYEKERLDSRYECEDRGIDDVLL